MKKILVRITGTVLIHHEIHTSRSKARPASLQTGEMQNAPRRSSDTERAETTKSKPLTASGGQKLTFAA